MAAGSLCLESKAWMVASLEGRMITRRVCPMGGSLSYGLRMLCYGFGLLDILGIGMHRCMDIWYDMGWQRRQKKRMCVRWEESIVVERALLRMDVEVSADPLLTAVSLIPESADLAKFLSPLTLCCSVDFDR